MVKFFGKYRATVISNKDPQERGRLQLMIPDVLGSVNSQWAEACAPLAGPSGTMLGIYLVPQIGSSVWAEFEQGDIDYPIWVGCRFCSSTDIPPSAKEGLPTSPNIVIQSMMQHNIVISDLPGPLGGITLKSASGAIIKINDLGIFIDNGKGATIELIGSSIDINKGKKIIK